MTSRAALCLVCSIPLWLPQTVHAENWPQFRGPSGQGVSSGQSAPLHWAAASNVLWKAAIPGEGWSSPIIWGDRVFVTTALENGGAGHLLCFDSLSGAVLWNKKVLAQSTAGRKEGRNTFATPTPATDGALIYTVFFDGTFTAVDFSGRIAWTNSDYPFYSQHGLGTSPLLWRDLLIMARDGSSDGENKKLGWQEPWDKSFIVALDKRTGKQVWKAARGQSRIGHVVPIVYTNGNTPILLSGAGDVVQGFDPLTGERLWTSLNQGEGVVPSPAAGEGLVFTACGFSGRDSIKAFRLGVKGEQETDNLEWEVRKGMPRVPSLLYVRPHVFALSDNGQLQCLLAATGGILGQARLGGNYSASPVYAAGRIYVLSDTGLTTVLEASPALTVLAQNPLEEKCQASMAVSHRRIFIRTGKHLFCIGEN